MSFWDGVKKDLQKGWHEGVEAFKEGAIVVREKAEELTEEGKRRYAMHEIKTKVQREIADLGGKVYELSSKAGNPLSDKKVQTIIARVNKLESDLKKLERQGKTTPKKIMPKKTTPKKIMPKKTTAKKTAKKKTVRRIVKAK
jgi:hypothetical protein